MTAAVAQPEAIVIVGAGLGGCRTAEGLRAGGFTGRLVLVSAETEMPYDRPPLSKAFLLGAAEADDVALFTNGAVGDLDLDLRLGVRAVGLEDHAVVLSDGSAVAFDRLVIATGVSARPFPAVDPAIQHRVLTLRTIDDSRALRSALMPGARVIIVGGGFIGAEVAAAARHLGCTVTMLEALDGPCVRAVGAVISAELAALYRSNGVELVVDAAVTAIRPGPDGTALVDVNGSSLPADVVVVGVGTVADLTWLPGSPSVLECGPDGAVDGMPDVYAVGDIAAWPDPWGVRRRIEHWERAGQHARVVATVLVGETPSSTTTAPYFWSDQFGVKVQMCGWSSRADTVVELHHASGRRLNAYLEGDAVVAVLTLSAPGLLAKSRALVARLAPLAELAAALELTR